MAISRAALQDRSQRVRAAMAPTRGSPSEEAGKILDSVHGRSMRPSASSSSIYLMGGDSAKQQREELQLSEIRERSSITARRAATAKATATSIQVAERTARALRTDNPERTKERDTIRDLA